MRRHSDARACLAVHRATGATLIELTVVIVIVGILATITASFMRVPMQTYFDLTRRAVLTDVADLAMRRLERDISRALPNSLRVTTVGAVTYLEYLEVRTGGRYRDEPSGGATTCGLGGKGVGYQDTLEIGFADNCFRTLGATPSLAQIVGGSDYLVVYNLGPGYPANDAYTNGAGNGGSKARIAGAVAGVGPNPEDRISFANYAFPLASPGRRFHVVSTPVSYVCDPAAGTLTRRWGYAIAAVQPTAFAGGSASLLATGVSACSMVYAPSPAPQRTAVVSIMLQLSQATAGVVDQVSLMREIHVSNVP